MYSAESSSWMDFLESRVFPVAKRMEAPSVPKITDVLKEQWELASKSKASEGLKGRSFEQKTEGLALAVDAFYRAHGIQGAHQSMSVEKESDSWSILLNEHLGVISDWSLFARFSSLDLSSQSIWNIAGETSAFGLFTGPFSIFAARSQRLEEQDNILPDETRQWQGFQKEFLAWLQTVSGGTYAVARNAPFVGYHGVGVSAASLGAKLMTPLFALIGILSAQSFWEAYSFKKELESRGDQSVQSFLEEKRQVDLSSLLYLLDDTSALEKQAKKEVQNHLGKIESLVGVKATVTVDEFLAELDNNKIMDALKADFGAEDPKLLELTPSALFGFYYACKKQQKIQEDAIVRAAGEGALDKDITLDALKEAIWKNQFNRGLVCFLTIGTALVMGGSFLIPALALVIAIKTVSLIFICLDAKGLWDSWQQDGVVTHFDEVASWGSLICSLVVTGAIIGLIVGVGATPPGALILASVGLCWVAVGIANIAAIHFKKQRYKERHLSIDDLKQRIQVLDKNTLTGNKEQIEKISLAFKHTMANSFLSSSDKYKLQKRIAVVKDLKEFEQVLDKWKILEKKRLDELRRSISNIDPDFSISPFAIKEPIVKKNEPYSVKTRDGRVISIDPRKEVYSKIDEIALKEVKTLNLEDLDPELNAFVEGLKSKGLSEIAIFRIVSLIHEIDFGFSLKQFYTAFNFIETGSSGVDFLSEENFPFSLKENTLVFFVRIKAELSKKDGLEATSSIGYQELTREIKIPLEAFIEGQLKSFSFKDVRFKDCYGQFVKYVNK